MAVPVAAGLKWKLSPKDDFYQEALDLLAGLDFHAKQQQSSLIKAAMYPADGNELQEATADKAQF